MYKILAHTADIGLEVAATSLPELFKEAARGWKHLVLEESPTREKHTVTIRLKSVEPEDLLVQWLNELNYLLTVKYKILHAVESIRIRKTDAGWQLSAVISVDDFDEHIHEIHFEIKAVTYHQLNIQRDGRLLKTKIIFDI